MRCINIDDYSILLQGESWIYDVLPCSKDAIPLLESNESVVTWLVPKTDQMKLSHTCTTHIPVIFYKCKYWTLSLRMSKCIYRHIRLRKGFKNIQTVHGVKTLRIPQLLFNEKQRTQIRFEVNLLLYYFFMILYINVRIKF